MWWILMEENNESYTEAEQFINKWLELNTKSPMVNLVKWKLEIKLWNIDKAFIYFKKTLSLDPDWDFWKIAKKELDNIKINK
jgi:tetratricopeptide (TPR) repeat protein